MTRLEPRGPEGPTVNEFVSQSVPELQLKAPPALTSWPTWMVPPERFTVEAGQTFSVLPGAPASMAVSETVRVAGPPWALDEPPTYMEPKSQRLLALVSRA